MTNAVIDASVLVRATIDQDAAAQRWVRAADAGEVTGFAPDLIWAEYGNALLGYVRRGVIEARIARRVLEQALKLRVTIWSGLDLAVAALVVSTNRGVSVYDAHYVALAEAHDAVLVTADRRLAGAYERAELLQ